MANTTGFSVNKPIEMEHRKTEREPKKIVEAESVSTIKDLDSLISILADVTEVGCFLPGVSNRYCTSPRIVLNVLSKLYCIDPVQFEKSWKVSPWKALDKTLFANPRISKVFFESKESVDYLYHRWGVSAVKVFDLKEMVWSHGGKKARFQNILHPKKKFEVSNNDKDNITLYKLCKTFLTDIADAEQLELRLLKEFHLTLRCRLKGVEVYESQFYAVHVKYLLILKRELQVAEAKHLIYVFNRHFKSVLKAEDEQAKMYFEQAGVD